MTRYLFSMYGRIGDITYATWYCKQRSAGVPYDMHLQTNVPDSHDPGGRKVFMLPEEAEYLASILREQPYIRSVVITDKDPVPARDVTRVVDLNRFRTMPSVYGMTEIRHWVYRLSALKPEGFDKPIFTVPPSDIEPTNKLLLCVTGRYKPAASPKALEPYKDKLVYVGLKEEHAAFCREYFHVEYQPVKSAKELLQIAQKSLGYIGNISGQYSFMEAAAIPRPKPIISPTVW